HSEERTISRGGGGKATAASQGLRPWPGGREDGRRRTTGAAPGVRGRGPSSDRPLGRRSIPRQRRSGLFGKGSDRTERIRTRTRRRGCIAWWVSSTVVHLLLGATHGTAIEDVR